MSDSVPRRRVTLHEHLKHAARLLAKRLGLGPRLRKLKTQHAWEPAFVIGRRQGWDAAAQWLLGPGRPHLAGATRRHLNELAQELVVDAEQELLLSELRRQLLFSDVDILADEGLCALASALIQQCDINEYVFFVTDEEARALAQRPINNTAIARGSREAALDLVKHAMYIAPRVLVSGLEPRISFTELLPASLAAIMNEARSTFDAEMQIASRITCHGRIRDAISEQVAAQYEQNPYPRWTSLQVEPGFRRGHLHEYFESAQLGFLDAPFQVMVAGCATGRQAIRCGIGYGRLASVLAIDLSRASLAFAARKATELGTDNIEFLQADIIDLAGLNRQFDIVECTGVLHHMADPMAGWHILTQLMKPGGLMYVGLYSQIARRTVSHCREEIAARALAAVPDDIRRYRRELLQRYGPERIWLREQYFPFCRDFFTLSNCRDLLFHVNEHQFTIPQIKAALDDLSLEFHGFIVPPLPGDRLWSRFPAPEDIDAWWSFEQRNSETFCQMYEFWCRKPA
jgi:2-polyprenyl-3-methyl-5-hydroxy-6-metoxy-1,4-benzoquinol methylase